MEEMVHAWSVEGFVIGESERCDDVCVCGCKNQENKRDTLVNAEEEKNMKTSRVGKRVRLDVGRLWSSFFFGILTLDK